jgi:site-specific DNA-methyltransferase (adenine-specific)
MTPYYADSMVTLYHGDCRELLPSIDSTGVSCVIADPPYGETSLAWDRWPTGWVGSISVCVPRAASLWCFGSMRMFLDHGYGEFPGWSFAQEVVWEKHNGSSFHADRFKRVHELATHWYRGPWADVFKAPVTTPDALKKVSRRKRRPAHMGDIGNTTFVSEDGGPRLMRSVIYCRSEHGRAQNETQKPIGIVSPLIRYSCPPDGVVLSPFAGAGTDLVVAKALGLRAIGIELRESQCEIAAERCRQEVLELGA